MPPRTLFRASLALLAAALALLITPGARDLTLHLVPVAAMGILTRHALPQVPGLRRVITASHLGTGVIITVTGAAHQHPAAWVAGPLSAALLLLLEARRPATPAPPGPYCPVPAPWRPTPHDPHPDQPR